LQHAFKFFNGIDGNGAVDNMLGNADLSAERVIHPILLDARWRHIDKILSMFNVLLQLEKIRVSPGVSVRVSALSLAAEAASLIKKELR